VGTPDEVEKSDGELHRRPVKATRTAEEFYCGKHWKEHTNIVFIDSQLDGG
jgi:hypothetical protein